MGLTDLINKTNNKIAELKIKSSEKAAQKQGFTNAAQMRLEKMKVKNEELIKGKTKKRNEALDEVRQKTKAQFSNSGGMSPRMQKVNQGLEMFGKIIQPAPEPRSRGSSRREDDPLSMLFGPKPRAPKRKKGKSKKKSKSKRKSKPRDTQGEFWKQFQ